MGCIRYAPKVKRENGAHPLQLKIPPSGPKGKSKRNLEAHENDMELSAHLSVIPNNCDWLDDTRSQVL